jgi:hypothetical protein
VDTPDRPEPDSDALMPAPWYQRVLPVTLWVLVVIALAATLVPGVRHQLALSLTRQQVSYAELYFARPTSAGAQAACVRRGDSVRVRFVVQSHLARRQPVAYRVVVDPSTQDPSTQDPSTQGQATRRQAGSAEVSPTKAVAVTRTFKVQRGAAYVLSVELPAFDQQLRVRCPVSRR